MVISAETGTEEGVMMEEIDGGGKDRQQTRKEEILTRTEERTREARNIARDPTQDGEKEITEKRRPL